MTRNAAADLISLEEEYVVVASKGGRVDDSADIALLAARPPLIHRLRREFHRCHAKSAARALPTALTINITLGPVDARGQHPCDDHAQRPIHGTRPSKRRDLPHRYPSALPGTPLHRLTAPESQRSEELQVSYGRRRNIAERKRGDGARIQLIIGFDRSLFPKELAFQHVDKAVVAEIEVGSTTDVYEVVDAFDAKRF